MAKILEFITNNYVIFLTISILLIFALIGYFVDIKRKKDNPYKLEKQEEISLDSLNVNENIALSDALNKNKNVGASVTPAPAAPTENIETLDAEKVSK